MVKGTNGKWHDGSDCGSGVVREVGRSPWHRYLYCSEFISFFSIPRNESQLVITKCQIDGQTNGQTDG